MSKIEQKKQLTNEAILKNAIELFQSDGYDKTSMRAIAQKSGIAVGTLYNYYQTKGDIFIAAISQQNFFIFSDFSGKEADRFSLINKVASTIKKDALLVIEIEKSTWKSIFQVITDTPEKNNSYLTNLTFFDQEYLKSLKKYLLANKQLFASDFDFDTAINVLYNSLGLEVIKYIYSDMQPKTLVSSITKHVNFIFSK